MQTFPISAAKPFDAATVAQLQSWTGREESVRDCVSPTPMVALSSTLDREDALPGHPTSDLAGTQGSELPPLWHWLYFLPLSRHSELGVDGHPRRGGFMPPVPLPRRMWAGGRLRWESGNALRVGEQVERVTRIGSVTHKAGRSGNLVFVQLEHEVRNSRGTVLREEQDIVYRPAALAADPPPVPLPAETGAAWRRQVVPDPVLLFRYSALTFNSHRIHYDRSYATGEEGYPGLVVHGPLTATLLADLVRRHAPGSRMLGFEFRGVRPAFDLHPLHLNGQPSDDGGAVRLWASDDQGLLTMQATATLS